MTKDKIETMLQLMGQCIELLGHEMAIQDTRPKNDPAPGTINVGKFQLVFHKSDPSVKENYLKSLEFKGGDIQQNVKIVSIDSEKEDNETMKYITKRSDGRWQARKTINGKRVCVYAKTQKECAQKLRALSNRKEYASQQSFYKFALYYLETYKKGNIADRTYADYKGTVDRHLAITTSMNRVTLQQLQAILNKMPATRQREETFKLMRQIVRKAYEMDMIKKDYAQFLVVGKITKGVKRALNIDEQIRLMSGLKDDLFSKRVIFYLCTGARPAEFATVKKSEIRPGWIKINGTKTKNAVRWVKVSEKLTSMLLDQSVEFFKFDPKKFRLHLQRVAENVGIEYEIDTYTLRHTFATNLYILRVPEKDRQVYMGHSAGSALTNDVYTTFSPDTTADDIYSIYGDFYPKF